jgi:outer membrane receptor protein involved in Fe transport
MSVYQSLQKSLMLCAIFSSSAWAEQQYDLFEISLDQLSQIVITGATLHEETLKSVPASVTVYTREQIRQLGFTRLTQLMNYVPGFQSQRNDQSANKDAYSARGGSFDSSNREILILLDGQRLNSDWSGGMSVGYRMLDLYLADRVEFIRGASSPIYGSNAYMGIVNITTKARNEFDMALGLNGRYEGSAQFNHEFDQGQVELFIKTLNDEGQQLEVYDSFTLGSISSRDPYGLENIHLKAKLGKTSFIYHQQQTSSNEFYVFGLPSNDKNAFDGDVSFTRLDHTFDLTSDWQLQSSLAYASHRFDLATVVNPAPVIIEGTIEEQEPRAEIILKNSNESGDATIVGFEWRKPKIVNSDAYLSGAAQGYLPQAPLTSRTIMGAFIQHQDDLFESMHYVLGVRVDDYSNFGDHAAPRAGLVWEYDHVNTLKLLYGESFRAPSRSETDITNSAALLANPDLEPEIAKTSEIVWLHQPENVSLSATWFYTELTDVIMTLASLAGEPSGRINSGNEYLSGLELEYQHEWHSQLTSRMNATWLTDGVKGISSQANFFAGGSVVYRYEKIQTALMFNYHSSKQDEDASTNGYRDISSRTFLDLNVRWQLKPNIEWYTHVSNALDQEYLSVATAQSSNVEGVANRGLDFITGIRFTF